MWSLVSLIPMFASLFSGGGGDNPQSPQMQRLLPHLETLLRTQTNRTTAAQPLYDAVLRQAFRGLPLWARQGVPGAGRELQGLPPLIQPNPPQQ